MVCQRLSVLTGVIIVTAGLSFWGVSLHVWAQEADVPSPREKQLRQDLKRILDELDQLKQPGAPASGGAPPEQPSAAAPVRQMSELEGGTPEVSLQDMSIVSQRVQMRPAGVSISATEPTEYQSQPTRHMRESLESLPGVIIRQANGPRDFSISIRGSGVKTTFAVRELKMYEDGFIQTQSDGLSRLDIHDPWFMRSVEVTKGASSSLYDNYALGGMIHFKTRRGSDINGVETFLSGGSFGYQKQAVAVGKQYQNLDVSLFVSNVAEQGYIRHSDYDTQTINFNFRFKIDDKQNFYFKAINNWLDANVPTRLTLSQFRDNPRYAGGTSTSNDAKLLAQRRLDRRTIIGGLYERELDANTTLTIEADYDLKDINQTFTQITDNINPNYKHYTDLRHNGRLGDMPLKSYVGFFVNNMEQEGQSFANQGDYQGTRGVLRQRTRGTIRNVGGRVREELEFVPKWTLAGGLGFEQSQLSIQAIDYSSAGAVSTRASADRTFSNWAPELSLSWKPAEGYRHWIRGSTGYGIPQLSNLTTGLDGLAGTNFALKPQRNLNVEIGTESQVHKTLTLSATGYYVFFKNEIISQVNSSSGGSFSVNADSSQYRGVELAYNWRPAAGWRFSGAYTHVDAKYINFTDKYGSTGAVTTAVRDGKEVPNVARDVINFKEEYDHPSGWGGWFETSYHGSYFLNNNNTVRMPEYWLLNLNLHKNMEFASSSYIRSAKFYLQLDNVADTKYAASGNIIADSTADASKTLFFAGYGRALYGGVTLGF